MIIYGEILRGHLPHQKKKKKKKLLLQISQKFMFSDKTIHRAFRIHETLK